MKNIQIDKRENTGNIDCWTEYLFLERQNSKNYIMSIKSHLVIDSTYDGQFIDKYRNDDGEYKLPKNINGFEVLGWESDCLVSTELENNINYDILETCSENYKVDIEKWLENYNWVLTDKQFTKIDKFIKSKV